MEQVKGALLPNKREAPAVEKVAVTDEMKVRRRCCCGNPHPPPPLLPSPHALRGGAKVQVRLGSLSHSTSGYSQNQLCSTNLL